jgi:hypothetical protein
MDTTTNESFLQEAEQLTHQVEQFRPCWDELLEYAHAIGERIQEQVEKITEDGDL